jgi:hypothetical protein
MRPALDSPQTVRSQLGLLFASVVAGVFSNRTDFARAHVGGDVVPAGRGEDLPTGISLRARACDPTTCDRAALRGCR